jgi:hypothetical protein
MGIVTGVGTSFEDLWWKQGTVVVIGRSSMSEKIICNLWSQYDVFTCKTEREYSCGIDGEFIGVFCGSSSVDLYEPVIGLDGIKYRESIDFVDPFLVLFYGIHLKLI